MAASYSQDLRNRVLAVCDRGMKTKQVAMLFDVSPAWVRRVKQRRREHGELSPRRMGPTPGRYKVDRNKLLELVREQSDATLMELRDRLGVRCAISTISIALKKLGYSFKKRSSMRRNRTGRTSWKNARSGVNARGSPAPAD
jgi:transposase